MIIILTFCDFRIAVPRGVRKVLGCSYSMDDSLVTTIVLPRVPPTATASRLDWCARNTAVNRLALVCSLWRGALHPAADLSAAPVQSTPDSLQRCISLNHPSDVGPELWPSNKKYVAWTDNQRLQCPEACRASPAHLVHAPGPAQRLHVISGRCDNRA